MTLHGSFSIIDETKEKMNSIPSWIERCNTWKSNELSNKNNGLEILRKINAVGTIRRKRSARRSLSRNDNTELLQICPNSYCYNNYKL